MKQLMPKLTERLKDFKSRAATIPVPLFRCEVPEPKDETITQAWFWPRLASFFKGNDVIVTETGRHHSQSELPAFNSFARHGQLWYLGHTAPERFLVAESNPMGKHRVVSR